MELLNKQTEYEEATCKECGNCLFAKYYKIAKVSALKSPTGKEAWIEMPTYVCTNCNMIFDNSKASLV